MKNTVLLPGALSLGLAIATSSAFAQAPAEEKVAPKVMNEAASPALLTDPENPVVIAEDDAKEARMKMSKAPFDMKTLRGKSYSNCKVLKVDPDGLFFRHSGGIAKLSFVDLPENVRERFDYDSDEADKFVKKHRAVIAKIAKEREQQQTIIVNNNNSPQFGGGGFGGGGFGFGNSQFGFPFAFPFGVPRSDAAAPFFGFPNVSFQAGVPRRAGSPIAPGLISRRRFEDVRGFVQEASGFPAPRGVQTIQRTNLGAVGPGTFSPPAPIFTSPRPVAPSGLGGIRRR